LSPWAALADPSDEDPPALPAPLGHRYAVLLLHVRCLAQSGATFRVVARQAGPATAELHVGDKAVTPLGLLSSPPDLLDPLVTRPIPFPPAGLPVEIALAFLLPATTTEAFLFIEGQALDAIRVPPDLPVPLERFTGTWRKLPRQRPPQRQADPLLDSLASPDQQLIAVRSHSPGQWILDLPFTNIAATARPSADNETVAIALQLGGEACAGQARLLHGGDVMVLYLGPGPGERLAYRRVQR
jgi:hypothetical protein